ncbi:MAG: DUF1638 domain-containing protein, partial [Planctomycetaceae bacterium]|nr:DUF1638 domain-containing protein [Planctomycetaceae bacterium]
FKTTGWLERGESLVQTQGLTPGPNDDTPRIPDGKSGKMISFRQMVERYGEKNARYIWEQLIGMPHYKRMTFIEMGIEPNDQFEQLTRQQAEERNWEFDKIAGSLTLLDNLINGHWNDEDFLVVQPGEKIEFDYTGQIIRAV